MERAVVSVYAFMQVILSPLLYPHGYVLESLALGALWFHSLSLHGLPVMLPWHCSTANTTLRRPHSFTTANNHQLQQQQLPVRELLLGLLEITVVLLVALHVVFSFRGNHRSPSPALSSVSLSSSFTPLWQQQQQQQQVTTISDSGSDNMLCRVSVTGDGLVLIDTCSARAMPILAMSQQSLQSLVSDSLSQLLSHSLSLFRLEDVSLSLRCGAVLFYISCSTRWQALTASLLDTPVFLFLSTQLLLATQLYPYGFLAQLALLWFLVFVHVLLRDHRPVGSVGGLHSDPLQSSDRLCEGEGRQGVEEWDDDVDEEEEEESCARAARQAPKTLTDRVSHDHSCCYVCVVVLTCLLHNTTTSLLFIIQDIVDLVQCKICFSQTVDTLFLNCGHTCCSQCCRRILANSLTTNTSLCSAPQRERCPFCKLIVVRKVDIYFP
jgi:hypothetical protein